MRWLAIILITCLSFQQLSGLLVIADFATKVDEITLKYCVNKEKTELKCNGKCHLRKTLKKTESEEQEQQQEEEVLQSSYYAFFSLQEGPKPSLTNLKNNDLNLSRSTFGLRQIHYEKPTPPPQILI